jgi:hypothetical protein
LKVGIEGKEQATTKANTGLFAPLRMTNMFSNDEYFSCEGNAFSAAESAKIRQAAGVTLLPVGTN